MGREYQASIQSEDLVEDPYCHTYIPISRAEKLMTTEGIRYFCSRHCLEAYRQKMTNEEKR